MKVDDIFSLPDAAEDIFNIYTYNDTYYSRRNAVKTTERIKEAIIGLKKNPEVGNLPPELERVSIHEYRDVHVLPNKIIYQIINNSVYVHCILDLHRDMQSLLMDRLLKYD